MPVSGTTASRVPPTAVTTCGTPHASASSGADRERLPARGEHVDVELAQVVGGRRADTAPSARPALGCALQLGPCGPSPAITTAPAEPRRGSRARRRAGRRRPSPRRSDGHGADHEPVAPAGRRRTAGEPLWTTAQHARVQMPFARAQSRSTSQTPMIAAVGGASSALDHVARTRGAPRASRPRTGTRAACRRPAAARSSRPAAPSTPALAEWAWTRSNAAQLPHQPPERARVLGRVRVVAPERQRHESTAGANASGAYTTASCPCAPSPARSWATCSATPPSGGSQTRAIRAIARRVYRVRPLYD